ncbi:MAG TPA: DeoR/GlpR family DNA-binding transcription regulator [Blastocatellia bacterium]|nr:DeoR/GlpR family DNA-binding transcription regulator [Blastocatellia bacterium]
MASESTTSSKRSDKILEELLRHGEVSVENLAKQFEVSAATIRRDLGELEQQGLLRRNHGGAVPVAPMLYEPFRNLSSFQEQEQKCTAEKRQIGLMAASLIADGDVIAIGAGTTTTQVARSIRHRKGITVLTNAVNIAMELSHLPDITVCMTGGVLSGAWFALVGDVAQRTASETFVDKAIIGVDGFHHDQGLTSNYADQAAIHRALMKQARQRIVVADHRKIGVLGTSLIWPTTDVDYLIVDKATTDEALDPFTAKGVRVLRA